MQAGTLREGGRLPVLATDDGSGHGGVQCGTLTATARDGSGSTGDHTGHCSRQLWGESATCKQGVSEVGSDEWRRTVGEPIHGLNAASLTLEGQSQDTDTEKRVKLKIEQVVRWSRVVTCCVRTSTRGPTTTFTLAFFVPTQLSVFHGLTSPGGPLPASAYPPSVP